MKDNDRSLEGIPPKAKKVPYEMTHHNHTRVDDYYWMRLSDEQKNAKKPDVQTKEVLSYLNEENSYTQRIMKDTDSLQADLFNEIVGRIKQEDISVPYKHNDYYYYSKYHEGSEYPLYCRKKDSLTAEETVILNVPEMAKGYDFYNIGSQSISPNNKIVAYGEDTLSRRIYTICFKNLETGEKYEDRVPFTTGSITWANDNKSVYYAQKDEALRSYKIFKHVLGTPVTSDVEVYHEEDETFSCYVFKTKSEKYIVIGSFSTLTTEYRVLDADYPEGQFRTIHPRERGLEYYISHFKHHFYIRTNLGAKNFKLVRTPVNNAEKDNWKEVIPHREDVLLEDIEIFKNHLVVEERKNGLNQLRIIEWNTGDEHYLKFPDDTYTAGVGINMDIETEVLRFNYSSLTTPNSTFDYNMVTKERELLKQQEVVGGYDAGEYHSERLYVTARDGVKVPVSLVYKKSLFQKTGKNPLILYGYGSYGYSMDPNFSSVRLSLLDRGFVYAIAHIRGGEEMGRQWYDDGKLLKKKNTFTDFIDCAEFLIKEKYVDKDKVFGFGGSAGGLLMGTVMNMRPKLWKGIVAAVPFVDVVTTMLDESIPLTTGEYDEWGNPNEKAYYDYILSYSPYDNIEKKDYPNLLVTTGYFDSQVQYWEPAKWVAKLRASKTDNNMLLLHTNMDTGHGGASGRFEPYKETALQYAFFIKLAGLNSVQPNS